MPLEVLPLSGDGIEWDAFVRSAPGGSPFHLVAWKRAVESSFGHRPHYVMAVGEHGIEGVLPLFEVRGLLGGRGLISVPYGVYGGICARSAPARQVLLAHASELARHVGAGYGTASARKLTSRPSHSMSPFRAPSSRTTKKT